jgi:hypothetical protein
MPGAVRYIGMFRTAAVVYVALGACFLWSYGLTDRFAAYRLYGLAGGVLTIVVGILLFRRTRFAIASSALGTGIVCLLAIVGLPAVHGPVILLFAALALLTAIYTALSLRVLFSRDGAAPGR